MSENEAEDAPDADSDSRQWGTLTALFLVFLVVGGIGAYALAFGPGVDGGQAGPPDDSVRATTATSAPSTAAAGSSRTTTASGAAFSFAIDRIERCGQRCRDVTVTLTNTGQSPASNTHVTTRIFAGDKRIWQGQSDLGTLDVDEAVTRTRRVKIGYLDAARIKSNDGYIRIETSVTWDGGSTTFVDRRKVA
ncbi:hypothetical protein ACFQJD_18715 [Haloplanus sp. GCM10025708]|uniref:hypothetical protein n=1 Tax=Haloferacaceae TaxID=1644056 RepID=UPI0036190D5D